MEEWRLEGSGERKSEIRGKTEGEERGGGVAKGGHRWHGLAVCPGTAAGRSSTPALSPVPVDLQADCHLSQTHTHSFYTVNTHTDAVMRTFRVLHP